MTLKINEKIYQANTTYAQKQFRMDHDSHPMLKILDAALLTLKRTNIEGKKQIGIRALLAGDDSRLTKGFTVRHF